MTVEIDLNVRVRGNQTFVGLLDIPGACVGDAVTVRESESGLSGPGWVTDIDWGKGLVYLRVDWPKLQ